MKRGIVFAATGEPGSIHITMAQKAAIHVKQVMPQIDIHLFTNQTIEHPAIDKVIPLNDGAAFRPKLEAMSASEFDQTIYLDNDIAVLADISMLFEVLDRFDYAIAGNERTLAAETASGAAYPVLLEKNSGVLAFRKSESMIDFLDTWRDRYVRSGDTNDQFHMMQTMFEKPNVAWLHLPRIFNTICSVRSKENRLTFQLPKRNEPMIRVLHLCGIKKLGGTTLRELKDVSRGFHYEKHLSSELRRSFRKRMKKVGWEDQIEPELGLFKALASKLGLKL
ncbi:MAG: hypothetical protein AAFR98_03770 [Pseudomonadota bacterium]